MSEFKAKLNRWKRKEKVQEKRSCAIADNKADLFSNSGHTPIQQAGSRDRRVVRTQKQLREALHSLIREKDYDSIVVKEIVDRADVGRSAFYTHFRDKDDLLVSSIRDMLESVPSDIPERAANSYQNLLWFSLPIFEYHNRHRQASTLHIGDRGRAILHDHLKGALSNMIRERLEKLRRHPRRDSSPLPVSLLVEYIATTFILVLDWWLGSRSRLSPKQADDLFRSLVISTLVEDEA